MLRALRENNLVKKFLAWFSLFGSFGTLICCALPSTLVLLGLGSTLASLLGNFPFLIWLSENKGLVFGFSFSMLFLSYIGQRYAALQACPIDQKENCEQTKQWARPVLWISLFLNCVGTFYAFVLPHLL
jgi:hypothetical protein